MSDKKLKELAQWIKHKPGRQSKAELQLLADAFLKTLEPQKEAEEEEKPKRAARSKKSSK